MNKTTAIGISISGALGLGVTYGLRRLDIRRLYSYGAGVFTVPVGLMVTSVVSDRSSRTGSSSNEKLNLSEFDRLLGTWENGANLIEALSSVHLPAETRVEVTVTTSEEMNRLDENDSVFIFSRPNCADFCLTKSDLRPARSAAAITRLLEFDLAASSASNFANFLQTYLGQEAVDAFWRFDPHEPQSDPLTDAYLSKQEMVIAGGAALDRPNMPPLFLYWDADSDSAVAEQTDLIIADDDIIRMTRQRQEGEALAPQATIDVHDIRSGGKQMLTDWLHEKIAFLSEL